MLCQTTPIWTGQRLQWPRTAPTFSECYEFSVRALTYRLSPGTQVRLLNDTWQPVEHLAEGDTLWGPRYLPRTSLADRSLPCAQAYMHGILLNKLIYHDKGRQVAHNIYGSAPDPALDHEDPHLYGHFLLGLTFAARFLGVKDRYWLRSARIPERDLQLMTALGQEPVFRAHDTVALNLTRASVPQTVPTFSKTRDPKCGRIRRTQAPLVPYRPGTYDLPNLQIRIPE